MLSFMKMIILTIMNLKKDFISFNQRLCLSAIDFLANSEEMQFKSSPIGELSYNTKRNQAQKVLGPIRRKAIL
jgi:hypothetical protein